MIASAEIGMEKGRRSELGESVGGKRKGVGSNCGDRFDSHSRRLRMLKGIGQ